MSFVIALEMFQFIHVQDVIPILTRKQWSYRDINTSMSQGHPRRILVRESISAQTTMLMLRWPIHGNIEF